MGCRRCASSVGVGGFSKGGLSPRGERGELVWEGFFAHEGVGAAEVVVVVLDCRHCNPGGGNETGDFFLLSLWIDNAGICTILRFGRERLQRGMENGTNSSVFFF